MANERDSCFTCGRLEIRRQPDGTWTCWCTVEDIDLGKMVVNRRACAAHTPRWSNVPARRRPGGASS